MMKVFDAHCHLQDPRIYKAAPQIIETCLNSGILHFAVNGVSEHDWDSVKQLSDAHPSIIIPNFGLHPWYVAEKSANWFNTLKMYFVDTPSAAVGEIGLDKGTRGREIDFSDQVEAFRQQLQLAKELKKPASIHCVRAYGDLLEILNDMGPFPAGVILHSYLGSAEMVPQFAKLGAYFSFSGFLMSMKEQKARKMMTVVPSERILLESDAPDALPKAKLDSLFFVEGDASISEGLFAQGRNSNSTNAPELGDGSDPVSDTSTLPKETLNHPVNIHNVLAYVATLLQISKEELAEVSYRNAVRLFSYDGAKVFSNS